MYKAYITVLTNVRKHPNADRLLLADVFGNTVCVSTDYTEGQLGVYFPTDGQLSAEFAEKNKILKLKVPVPNGITLGDGPYIVEEKTAYTEQPYQKWFGVKQNDGKVFAVING